MPNELVLVLSLLLSFWGALVFFRLFAKTGAYAWTVLTTISANIEVLILIRAFGLDQTLGNTLFAATFVATDILSECYGKKEANKAVYLGIATNLAFVLLSQSWFLYTPSEADWVMPSIKTVFSNTPRVMLASLLGYAVSEKYDVWSYHFWWNLTTTRFGDSKRFLWLRNNVSTLTAQLINTVLFNCLAFWGIYDTKMLISVIVAGYAIYVCTSLLDTPVIYFARWLFHNKMHTK